MAHAEGEDVLEEEVYLRKEMIMSDDYTDESCTSES